MAEQLTTEQQTRGCLGCLAIVLFGFAVIYFGSNWDYETTPPKDWTAERELQPKRKQLIDQLTREGIFHRVDIRDAGATVVVPPAFQLLSFEDKGKALSVVYIYAATQERQEYLVVDVRDSLSNKQLGAYSKRGLSWR